MKAIKFLFIFLSLIHLNVLGQTTVNLDASDDSYIDRNTGSGENNTNYGSGTTMRVEYSRWNAWDEFSLVKFDLSSIPSGATITSATLKLVKTGGDTGAKNLAAHRLTKNWVESQTTWNIYSTGNNWTNILNVTSDYAAATATTSVSANATYSWDVTSDVQNFVDAVHTNYGWLMRYPFDSNTDDGVGTAFSFIFGTSENATSGNRPVLTVEYSAAPTIDNQTASIDNCSGLDLTFQAEITSDGGSAVTTRGFIYSLVEADVNSATIDVPGSATLQTVGSGTGVFSYSPTALSTSTWYYKSFARNSGGDSYGSTMNVGPCSTPTVTTNNTITSLFCEGAQLSVTVTNTGGQDITSKGVLIGTSNADVTAATASSLLTTTRRNSGNSDVTTGTFSVDAPSLSANTTYYFKAFAQNASGYSYGAVQSFATPGLCSSYGSYVGDGVTGRQLVGLGYNPDLLIIRREGGGNSSVIASSTMPSGEVKLGEGSTALQTGYLTIITNGFEVTDNTAVNANGVTYHFLAFEAGSELAVGSYTGNGGANSVTGLSFDPAVIFLMGDDGSFTGSPTAGDQFAMHMATLPGNGVVSNGNSRNIVSSFDVGGYTIGSEANNVGSTYHYAALGITDNQKQAAYAAGNNVIDHETVVEADFSPNIVFATSNLGNRPWYFRSSSMTVNESFVFGTSPASTTAIRDFTNDGFTKGSNTDINSTGTANDHSYFAMRGVKETVLPVELIKFQGVYHNSFVELTWQTGVEINASHFLIQRSSDGKNFETIGRINAEGNSTKVISYAYYDNNPLQGNNYYRLHQFDIDGKSEKFKPIFVNTNQQSNSFINLFPNPVFDIANIGIQSDRNDEYFIEVLDTRGRTVLLETFKTLEGFNTLQLQVGNLANGVYHLRAISSSNILLQSKFIKQ
jgi:hypothetical protein